MRVFRRKLFLADLGYEPDDSNWFDIIDGVEAFRLFGNLWVSRGFIVNEEWTEEFTPRRVTALRHLNEDTKTAHVYGDGNYLGMVYNPDLGFETPKIKLDDGRVIWGIECFWDDVEKIQELIAGFKIVELN